MDKLVVARGLARSRNRAQALIMAGEVFVDGIRVDKVGTQIPIDAVIEVVEPLPFVSRGGFKLAAALEAFGISVDGRVCADVGASTGGFTDVLLQSGAARVYAIDVGYGQLAWRIRNDGRVIVLERTNARHLEELPEPIEIVVIDVSFISLKLILPAVSRWTTETSDIIALVKPQFEAGKNQVGKGGIVRDAETHRAVLRELVTWSKSKGLRPAGLVRSPIEGAGGNREFLLWLRPDSSSVANFDAAPQIDTVTRE